MRLLNQEGANWADKETPGATHYLLKLAYVALKQ